MPGLLVAAAVVLLGWPLITTLFGLLIMVVARVQLGRWPHRMGLDDPKDIPVVDALTMLWVLGLMGALPAAAVGLGFSGFIGMRNWRLALLALLVGLACWALAFLVMEWTEVGVWLLD